MAVAKAFMTRALSASASADAVSVGASRMVKVNGPGWVLQSRWTPTLRGFSLLSPAKWMPPDERSPPCHLSSGKAARSLLNKASELASAGTMEDTNLRTGGGGCSIVVSGVVIRDASFFEGLVWAAALVEPQA